MTNKNSKEKKFLFMFEIKFLLIFYFIYYINFGNALKNHCETDEDCELNWPNSVCRQFRCVCQPDSIIRVSSETPSGWVCLSLFDVG